MIDIKIIDKEKTKNDENLVPDQYIEDIRIGSSSNKMVIVINDSVNATDTLLLWNIHKNIEIEFFDVPNDTYEILWDDSCNMMIVKNTECIFIKQRCTVKCFEEIDLIKLLKDTKESPLKLSNGHRFDGLNNNWMVLKDYLSLPFCYMSFVIKHQLETDKKL